jgi:hypothetical protein
MGSLVPALIASQNKSRSALVQTARRAARKLQNTSHITGNKAREIASDDSLLTRVAKLAQKLARSLVGGHAPLSHL